MLLTRFQGRRWVVGMAIGLMTSAFVASASAVPVAAGSGQALSANRVATLAKAAVVLVIAECEAPVSIPNMIVLDSAVAVITRRLLDQVKAGQLDPRDQRAFTIAYFRELAAHFDTYVTADPQHPLTTTAMLEAAGTGFIVSADGVVVTAAHVATPKQDDLKKSFSDTVVAEVKKEAPSTLVEADLPADLNGQLSDAMAAWVGARMQIGTITTVLHSLPAGTVPGKDFTSIGGIASDLLAHGDPGTGTDVAILRMKSVSDMPTLTLGDDAELEYGDRVHAVGFPGVATFNPVLAQDQSLDPTASEGRVSGRKLLEGGAKGIQSDANITHGNSGGPLLNSRAEVVGVTDFGSVDPNTGQELGNFNFSVPVSMVRTYLTKAGVKAAPSRASRLFAHGLADYDRSHFKNAASYLRQAEALAPRASVIVDYRKRAEQQASKGNDRMPFYYCWLIYCPPWTN